VDRAPSEAYTWADVLAEDARSYLEGELFGKTFWSRGLRKRECLSEGWHR
jgi:hypothetical protein